MTTLSSVVGKVLTLTTQNQRNLRGSRVICPRKLSSGSFFNTIRPEMLAGRFSIQLGISSLIRRAPNGSMPMITWSPTMVQSPMPGRRARVYLSGWINPINVP